MTIFLSVEQIKRIHAEQIQKNGGLNGILNQAMLESAAAQPMATFDGQLLNDTLFLQASVYMLGLARNHAFADGNKRTALHTTYTFLLMNGFSLEVDDDQLFQFVLEIAENKHSKDQIAAFLEKNCITMPVIQ